jgi:hypothetical protein
VSEEEVYDSTDALSLRALQMLDEIANMDWLVAHRAQLLAAEDELAERLGLECTGIREPGEVLSYDHGKRGRGAEVTCPVHEWLRISDYSAIREREDEIEARARH